ncbi:Pseudouridine synthase, catalytic domain,Pseudouridine synthase I, TruA,Pseudouridine [Cinara cedri]|uniref:Pseudouridine synthase, catalytic domain,Pseudouridine synthase I, TruA,Pseudouridine n=1 Tax=Cinara cedri TaxID=506608 RepID=A0A5E4M648_9HEMI|nr:Pseudouridine synthase, catalytic domain,Pseudouridine synthase I, TruA,Pseudouridine [Cinara cedri]
MSHEIDLSTIELEYLKHLTKEELINTILELKNQNLNLKKLKNQIEKPKRSFDFTKYRKRHVAFKLLYLGWDYQGFATQDCTNKTIEYELFNALTTCCLIESRQTSNYHRCGRTDKGVSSFSQVISLTVRSNGNDTKELPYCKMLNRLLPKDIRIIAWSPVNEDFSARFNCGSRTYKYWFPRGNLDIDLMNEALQQVVGTHDFRNFCKMDVGNGVVQYFRRIISANVKICFENNQFLINRAYDMCELTIVGKAFLWHQIRCIVSILILVGEHKENINIFRELLNVEDCPRKPQYSLSSYLPLNLFDCQFENVNWIIENESLSEVVSSLQCSWATHSIKATMLGEMLKNTETLAVNKINNQSNWLIEGVTSKIYQPLLKRPASASLENRIEHYKKKGKLKLESK